MNNDEMPPDPYRPLTDEELAQVGRDFQELDREGPDFAAVMFCRGLFDWDEYVEAVGLDAHVEAMLDRVTPESKPRFRDFTEVIDTLAQFENLGHGTYTQDTNDPRVRIFPLMYVPEGGFLKEVGDDRLAELVVTLVWRSNAGGWKVHAVGEEMDATPVPDGFPGERPIGQRGGDPPSTSSRGGGNPLANDGYTLTADDIPDDGPEVSARAEALCKLLAVKGTPPITEVWEELDDHNRADYLDTVAPGNRWRSPDMLQHIQDALKLLETPVFAGWTVPTHEPDIRYVLIYDSLHLEEGFGLVANEDADLIATVLHCGDGKWRLAGFGGPARPEDIPRQ